ncbi:MAG: hypothetical protein ABIP35_12900 [Ginsengibacter sp.]
MSYGDEVPNIMLTKKIRQKDSLIKDEIKFQIQCRIFRSKNRGMLKVRKISTHVNEKTFSDVQKINQYSDFSVNDDDVPAWH